MSKPKTLEFLSNMSEREIAKRLGVSRHLAKKIKNQDEVKYILTAEQIAILADGDNSEEYEKVESFDPDEDNLTALRDTLGIPLTAITSHTISRWDTKAGRAEKITYNPRIVAIEESRLSLDTAYDIIDNFVYTPPAPQNNQTAAVLNVADLQIGKACQRAGGTEGTLMRAMQSLERFAQYVTETQPDCVVVVDNGDSIENFFNVSTQAGTNDKSLTEQIMTTRRLFTKIIKRIAPLVPVLYVVGVPSNHGQVRSGFKSPMNTTDDDFGLEIHEQVKDIFHTAQEVGAYANVVFVRPGDKEETAVVAVANTRLAFHHGHQSKGPRGHSDWWARQDHGRRPGWDADILVTAHFHSLRMEQSGDGRWIIGVSSSDPGSDWFTNYSGESAIQGMTAFDVSNGMWSNIRII